MNNRTASCASAAIGARGSDWILRPLVGKSELDRSARAQGLHGGERNRRRVDDRVHREGGFRMSADDVDEVRNLLGVSFAAIVRAALVRPPGMESRAPKVIHHRGTAACTHLTAFLWQTLAVCDVDESRY